jgi:hypothetical protein
VENLIGAITWANVAMGFIAKSTNAWLLLDTPYVARVWGMVIVMAIGLFVVAVSQTFAIALVGIVLAGAACSFGEGVVLGYLKLFDDVLVNGWSSGTGMAGVGGAALYLAFVAAGLDLPAIFYYTIPFLGAYVLAFHILVHPNRPPTKHPAVRSPSPRQLSSGVAADDSINTPSDTRPTHPQRRFERFWRCAGHCKFLASNLCFVYIFECVTWALFFLADGERGADAGQLRGA